MLRDGGFGDARLVIDVSGDGRTNTGRVAAAARDDAVAAGITINGLPILAVEPDLDRYYQDNVIGGTDAFTVVARDAKPQVAAVLGLPFVLAIGVLTFVGAFVPIIGATVAGSVAILVALVDQGPVTALVMFAGVVVVQQLEAHILQPFLMGRWVSVHPLGVIVAIGCGVLVAGIVGALVAVPLAAAVNAVVLHLASYSEPGDDPEVELAEDLAEQGESPETVERDAPAGDRPGGAGDDDGGAVGG